MSFKKDFVWGAAAAAYQIKGAAFEDGKGLSIWDVMCRRPDGVKNNDTGNVACDHYHRYHEDVSLMKELSLQAYRFSISWPRVLPQGTGKVNQKGLDFYDRLVDELLEKGITPYATLFHWDYPQALHQKGGWLNPHSSDWFAEYTGIVVDKLSDRVQDWMTFNEPQCFMHIGYVGGGMAPGIKVETGDSLQMAHNVLLAHGKATQLIKETAKMPSRVGFVPAGIVYMPVTDSIQDIEATRAHMFSVGDQPLWSNTWWVDPIYLGKYPSDGVAKFEHLMPKIGANDMKIIGTPVDFFGINMYFGMRAGMDKNGKPKEFSKPVGYARNSLDWEVSPEVLYWGPKFYYERYQKPVFITENGMTNLDWVSLDGKVHDPQRVDYLHRYLRQLRRVSEDGVDVSGYFCGSIMDNFEWSEGYKQRFGLIYVDYQTQERTIKDSGYWYKQVIENNGDNL